MGVARVFRRGRRLGCAVVRTRTNLKTKQELSTNKFRQYISGENSVTSKSLHKIYKFSSSQKTNNHFCCVFGCIESETTDGRTVRGTIGKYNASAAYCWRRHKNVRN